ncbi:hypothetical protein HY032_02830 [Candidatus Gottesmanbacteria bacterium]|nr:hypothetical protein [Candidatus Gottesmanbacteria bacterium]
MSIENSSFASNLRTGAQWVETGSRMPIGINRLIVDGILACVPPIAETVGVMANGSNALSLNGISATLLTGATSVSLFELAKYHHNTQMQISEWIGPGLAWGMRKAADIFDTKSSTP